MLPAVFPARIPFKLKVHSLQSSSFLPVGWKESLELPPANHEKFQLKSIRSVLATFNAATRQSPRVTCVWSKKEEVCRDSRSISTSYSLPEDGSPSLPSKSSQLPELGPHIDLNFPRRRLQVSFTCNACGARNQRLVNPRAYTRGTVFVQCAGCEVYHKLVDNLGLIDEIDYRLEGDPKSNESEV